jgi:hypothetical protein
MADQKLPPPKSRPRKAAADRFGWKPGDVVWQDGGGEDGEKHLPGQHDQRSHGNRFSGYWGGSHSGSRSITGRAAELLGTEGFHVGDSPYASTERLHARTALRKIRDSTGVEEPLYSGHVLNSPRDFQVGEEVVFPLVASTGDVETAESYAGARTPSDTLVVYKFPVGTKFFGYVDNREDEDWDREFNPARWGEAIVSGRFKVTEVRSTTPSRYFDYDKQDWVTVPRVEVSLVQTQVFDPDGGKWLDVV